MERFLDRYGGTANQEMLGFGGAGLVWISNHQRILVTEHRFRLIECFALFAAYSPPFSDSTWGQFVHVAKQYKILQKYLKFLGVYLLDFSQKW
jgi:hypothetical protein